MAKTRNSGKLTAKAVIPPPSAPEIGELVEFPDALAYIKSLTGEREGTEWNFRVYKVDASGRGVRSPQQYLFEIDLEDAPTLERQLAEAYPGGGSFKLVVRANNQIVRSAMLEIAPRPGYRPPPPAYLQSVQPTAPAADHSGDRMELFLTRMSEMHERAAAQAREETRALLTALTSQPKAPTLMEQLTAFAEFQKFLPKGAQENGMALFQQGMDVALKLADARGGGGGETNWLDVIKEVFTSPVMKDMLAGIAVAAQTQQGQAFPPQPTHPPALVAPSNPVAAQMIDTLIGQAIAGVDPKFVAAQFGDKMPEPLIAELEQQEDMLGYLISQFPRVGQHRPWFTALLAEFFEDDNIAPPSPTMRNPDATPPGA